MILFFDTETTGLPKNWKAPVTDLDNWPRLVQLAYLVYDFDGNLIHSCNEIIKPNGFTIPADASKVHGITTDIANQRGSKIEDVFELFSIHLKRAKVIVAHNMAYDEKIIGSELIRMGLVNTLDSKEKICTMESTVDLCKINGPYGYKWPKLEELHRFLFNRDFDGAHNALADIQATAKCFWELIERETIYVKNFILVKKSSINMKINQAIFGNNNVRILYRNIDNENTDRVLSNINYSDRVLKEDKLIEYNIDGSYITAFCHKRNEQRTFKIDRIIDLHIIDNFDISNFEKDLIIPILDISGQGAWKLFSLNQQKVIRSFQYYQQLNEFCYVNKMHEWDGFFEQKLYGRKTTLFWGNWELRREFKDEKIDNYEITLYFKNKKQDEFENLINNYLKIKYGFVFEINEISICELTANLAVLVYCFTIEPDWDEIGDVKECVSLYYIDSLGNIFYEK